MKQLTQQHLRTIEGALSLGFPLSAAIQRALGHSLSEFARTRGYSIQAVSMCLRNYGGRKYFDIRDDVCETLDIPREYLDRLIATHGGPEARCL